MKAVELNVDEIDETIIATLAYDSKLVCFLKSSWEEICWAKKTKKVWTQEQNCVQELEFLHLSSADNHNGGMGDVDAADQKRLSYQPYRFMRKIK